MKNKINILFCIDDFSGNYTRHCAVTIYSLLETNRNNKIKIFILSGYLPEKCKNELARIVNLYHQEIEFIISENIIPNDIKNNLIYRDDLTRGTFYRLFYFRFIKDIDRILYLNCDILVKGDIKELYQINMENKMIMGSLDTAYQIQGENFNTPNYINAGVLLFDVKKFRDKMIKIDINKLQKINKSFGKYITCADQDYLNIIFKYDIIVHNNTMNYLLIRRIFNFQLKNALIIHCVAKPYIENGSCPLKIQKIYENYLKKTIRKDYPKEKRKLGNIFVYEYLYWVIFFIIKYICGSKNAYKILDQLKIFLVKIKNYI